LTEDQKDAGTVWKFNKSVINQPYEPIELDQRLVDQYNRTFGLIPEPKIVAPPQGDKIVKLFDE